jgi:predicted ester cyclase
MADTNKRIVQQFVDQFWNAGNLAIADQLLSADALIHLPNGEQVDVPTFKRFAESWRTTFPDWQATTDTLVAEGDWVAERWTGRGTQRGMLQDLPPTGRHVAVPGTVFYRLAGQRIVEFDGLVDLAGLLRQLGATAAAAGASA